MAYDPNKTYRTRSGLAVRIYATDGGGDYPIHGAYNKGGRWVLAQWTPDLRYFFSGLVHKFDLCEEGEGL